MLTPGTGEKGILEPRFFRSVFHAKTREIIFQQPFDYLCIYDLECNCAEDKSEIEFGEIVEFPVVILDVKTR